MKLISICGAMHITESEFLNPREMPDGTFEGYTTSDASYCPVKGCERSDMTPMDLVEEISG